MKAQRYIITRPCLQDGSLRLLKYLEGTFPSAGPVTLVDDQGHEHPAQVDLTGRRVTGLGSLYHAQNLGVNDVLMITPIQPGRFQVESIVKPTRRPRPAPGRAEETRDAPRGRRVHPPRARGAPPGGPARAEHRARRRDPAHPDARPETARPETARAAEAQRPAEAQRRADPAREPAAQKAQPDRVEPSRAESGRAEPSRVEPSRTETGRADTGRVTARPPRRPAARRGRDGPSPGRPLRRPGPQRPRRPRPPR